MEPTQTVKMRDEEGNVFSVSPDEVRHYQQRGLEVVNSKIESENIDKPDVDPEKTEKTEKPGTKAVKDEVIMPAE